MRPPIKKKGLTRANNYDKRKFSFKHSSHYLLEAFLGLIRIVFRLDQKTSRLLKRSWKIGNPMNVAWPSETLPMVSRVLAGGLWNFSFFQFHRNFCFPFWAKKQYNSSDKAFIPRSHNILSINQTQRNWVSISFPGKKHEVCIDPALAIMPGYDTPTVEFAVFYKGKLVRPHDEAKEIIYQIKKPDELECRWRKKTFTIKAVQNGVRVKVKGGGNLIFSLRPFNMEGPAFVDKIQLSDDLSGLKGDMKIHWQKNPDLFLLSNYFLGDSLNNLIKHIRKGLKTSAGKKANKKFPLQIKDPNGLSNAAFFYSRASDCELFIEDKETPVLPKALVKKLLRQKNGLYNSCDIWQKWFPSLAEARLPDKFSELFFHVRSHLLTLWDFNTVTPGSFTYHHFWIRDAAMMLYALMLMGGTKPVKETIRSFKYMLKRNGLFKSQTGEWDANGQALWVIGQYLQFSENSKNGKKILPMQKTIYRMLGWLEKSTKNHQGILPPGFSAEHLGVSDWYLWDNFWMMGGISALMPFQKFLPKYDLKKMYEQSLAHLKIYLKNYKYYPAALGRRKDAGMIGSVSAVYPLSLHKFYNKKMLATLKIIHKDHFSHGGFFQENIHSGVNPYLTLQMAEGFLHLGKTDEAFEIFRQLMKLSSVAYTFPEAVHPNTRSGCMGDGFHGWAFAEIIIFIKNIFFLELPDKIILLGGCPSRWFGESISFRNLNTKYGVLNIKKTKTKLIVEGLKDTAPQKLYLAIPSKSKKKVQAVRGVELIYNTNSEDIFITKPKGRAFVELTRQEKLPPALGEGSGSSDKQKIEIRF